MLRIFTNRCIGILGNVLLKLLGATLRWNVSDAAGYLSSNSSGPVIVGIWHNRILILPLCFEWICRRHRSITVLTSPSRDGLLLSEFVRSFGMASVFGSSSKRGGVALRQLQAAIKAGSDVAITPDGPRGPVYQLNPGMFYLASKMSLPIMPIQVEYTAYWSAKSWDKFRIPKPFSTVHIRFMKPIPLPASGDACLEKYRKAVVNSLGADDHPRTAG